MGGRGTKLNVDIYLGWDRKKRTNSYHTIFKSGNIKFLKQNDNSSVNSPVFSNTGGRVYVTLNEFDEIKAISVYGEDHIMLFSIHLGTKKEPSLHEHGPLSNRTRIEGKDMKKSHIRLVNRVLKLYNKNIKRGKNVKRY